MTKRKMPITQTELRIYIQGIKIGDEVLYGDIGWDETHKEDQEQRYIKMTVTGKFAHFAILRNGKLERSLSWIEMLIINDRKRKTREHLNKAVRHGINKSEMIKRRNQIIVRLYKSGSTPTQIAQYVDCSYGMINLILRQHGIIKIRTKVNHEEILRLKNKGLSYSQIAIKVKCSYSTVYRICDKKYIDTNKENTMPCEDPHEW